MKKICTSLLFIACTLQGLAQVTWTSAVTVTSGGTYGNQHPRLTLDRSGAPCVIWGKSATPSKAYFSKWTGSMFSVPVAVNGTYEAFAASWAGPDIASYGDTIYAVFKHTNPEMDTTHYTYLVRSTDGGNTFSMPMRIDHFGANSSRFPTVTTSATGQPIVGIMKFDSGTMMNARWVVARSTDWGSTFGADVRASKSTNEVCDCCPGALISSGSNLLMLFRDNNSDIRDSWAGISTDGGMSFPNHMNVDNLAWNFPSCPSTGPDGVVIGDSLFTVFRSGAPTPMVYYSRSCISTGTFGSRTPITGMVTGLTFQDFPRIANSGMQATMVYKQIISANTALISSYTSNIHNGFSDLDTVALSGNVVNADVAMSPGVIHIVWEDASGKIMYRKGTYTVPVTAVPEISRELISVYPNPASNQLTVSIDGITNITDCYLSDITGRHTGLQPVCKNGNAVFSVAGIARGSYYFVMHADGKQFYSKVVLE